VLVIPPGGRAVAHLHENHESAIYLIEGEAEILWGDGLAEHGVMLAGDFMYIPLASRTYPPTAVPRTRRGRVVARTDPNEQESVVLLPHLQPSSRMQ
jgi:uncharacterized RmlC-like cupin family protein